jgi:hypothetical protein
MGKVIFPVPVGFKATTNSIFWSTFYFPSLSIMSAAFSPIMKVAAFVLADTTSGMIEASATRRFLTPFTLWGEQMAGNFQFQEIVKSEINF